MRKIIAALCVLFVINGLFIFYRSGFSNTFLLNLGFILTTGVYFLYYERLIKIKWITYSVLALALISAGFGIFVMAYGRRDTTNFTEDAVIVLGAGIRADEEVTRTLRNRLDMAVEYHMRNPEAVIIVSGGIGRGHVVSEAEVMARYLEAAGVRADLIFQEGNSHSTYQNMRLSKEILDELFPDGYRVTVISNDFHIYRAIRFTRIAGMEGATSFHGNTPLDALPGALVREITAIVKMWLIGT